ncbi:MAG: hypothetical protein C0602_02440 [Denitrovibrio sp.]|nr:MAG: hypothetical protein C0602_02440 [Denitrovibrio sp.]
MWGGLWGESLKEKRSIYKNENLNSPSGHVKLKNAMAVVVCDNEKLLGQFVVANKKGGYDQSDFNIGLMIADTMRPILKFWTEDKFSKELLNEKREELRQQLLKEMELNRKQGQILFEQKKFVDMGQMMSAIAHQWRQPLNNIHLIMNSIEKLHEGEKVNFDFEELSRLHKETVEFMSNTIDSFRDYLTSDAKNASFSVTKAIADTVNLITAQFQSQNVNLSFYFQDKYMSIKSDTVNRHLDIDPLDDLIYGDIGSFHQIILNILSNARDAVLEYRADNPGEGEVNIFVVPEDDVIRITVQNIGNPIAEDVLPKIFDPYFTTKEDGKGTCVGLYMTKMFVEDGYKGKIYAANRSDGVEFVVSIPKDIKKGL